LPLRPGVRIGTYEIVAALGSGGMGEVYRARDMKLGRSVALKILAESVAGDSDRLARFEREARTLATLNHPNIAHVYDAGAATPDATPEFGSPVAFLAMELVEGDDLSVHISRGALPLAEALPIARQVAEAVAAAHEAGIVHRDLKPANIKVRPDGVVKVLDFGLAKALTPEDAAQSNVADSPTMTARGTELGMIIGTAAYMAPEQAKGRAVDRRADVWAFGVVLYEMLTGRRAFGGDDVTETLAAVLRDAPSLDALPDAPKAITRLLRRCLEKDSRRRLDSMTAVRLELEEAMTGDPSSAAPPQSAQNARISVAAAAAIALGLIGIAAATTWLITRRPAPLPPVVTRFTHLIPETQILTRGGRRSVTISPNGQLIAYIADRQIYIRRIDQLEAQPVLGTHLDATDLVFSPDSQSLAFFTPAVVAGSSAGGALRRVSIADGTLHTLCSADAIWGIRWQGSRVVFSTGPKILAVADTGGTPETLLTTTQAQERIAQPQLIDDGRALLYTVRLPGAETTQIAVQPLNGGARRVLVDSGMDGRLTSTGHLLWVRDSVLYAQVIDPSSLQLSGTPVAVVQGVAEASFSLGAHLGISDAGSLVFMAGSSDEVSELVWTDRSRKSEPVGAPNRAYQVTRVSPDGRRVAAITGDDAQELLMWDVARKTSTPLANGVPLRGTPVWSTDGRHVMYPWAPSSEEAAGLYRQAADGTGVPERLLAMPGLESALMAIGDGRVLVRATAQPGSTNTLHLWTPGHTPATTPMLPATVPPQASGDISPNGRWIAYQAREGSERDEIHVRPFPDTSGGHWRITTDGGTRPMWSRSGKELFYVSGAPPKLWKVDVMSSSSSGGFERSPAAIVFDLSGFALTGLTTGSLRTFDISSDDQRFLMRRAVNPQVGEHRLINVVLNWFEELRARVK